MLTQSPQFMHFSLSITTSKKMFKKEQKNAPFRNRKTINIGCKADCLFNNNGVCRANGITVNDTQTEKPVCMGYLKK